MPRNGLPESIASRTGRTSSGRRSSAMHVLEGPHARQHHFGGGGHLRGIAGHNCLVADLLEAFLHASQIAHTVVDDGDH